MLEMVFRNWPTTFICYLYLNLISNIIYLHFYSTNMNLYILSHKFHFRDIQLKRHGEYIF